MSDAYGGQEQTPREFVSLVASARHLQMLDHPAVVAAINWRAWLHPRGKDGRFIEKGALVNVFSDPKDGVTSRTAKRARAHITKLTPQGAHLAYYRNGKKIPASPANGFPAFVKLDDIHDKLTLAPKAVARLDVRSGVSNEGEWEGVTPAGTMSEYLDEVRNFNAMLKNGVVNGKSANEPGPALDKADAVWADHQSYVEDVTSRATAAKLSAATYLRDSDGNWSDDAFESFMDIVDEALAEVEANGVPKDGKAVILGGLPGAGKTTSLGTNRFLADAGLTDPTKWATINADDFKMRLADKGLVPKLEGMSVLEAALLVHTQSSEMGHMFGQALMAHGYNVVFDTTMGSSGGDGVPGVVYNARDLKTHGYDVDAVFVDVTVDVAISRQKKRWLAGVNEYRSGSTTYGGRYVPESASRINREKGTTASQDNFGKLREEGVLNRWVVFDNSETEPVLVQVGAGKDIVPNPDEYMNDPANVPGVYKVGG